jgi:hypothetical protein
MKKKEPSKLHIQVNLLNTQLNIHTESFCRKAFNFEYLFTEDGPLLVDISEGISYLYIEIK